MLQKKVVQKIKTHVLCSINFCPQKSRAVDEKMWKKSRVGEATDGNKSGMRLMRFAS